MDLAKYLENKERQSSFNEITKWLDRLKFAQMARGEWDNAFGICNKVRSNQIPLKAETSEISEFTDEWYKDNWILKANIWKESLLRSSDISVEVKTKASADDTDPNRMYLEMDLNYTMDEFDMIEAIPDVISDQVWYGYGVSYLPWNLARADKNWKTGKPDFRYHPCQAFWVDESSNQSGWTNRRWEFAKFQYDLEEAKEYFPEYADKIQEIFSKPEEGDSEFKREIFDAYLCQYRRTHMVDVVDVTWTDEGVEHTEQHFYKEVEDFIRENAERELPDNISVSDKYTVEKVCWFQFFFSPDLASELSEIEYVGDRDHFQIFWGLKFGNDVYPRSWTYFLSDLLDIKTVAMTLAAVQAIKNGNPTPYLEQGAILNLDEYINNRNSLDFVAQISEEWRQQHPGEKPVTFDEGRYDANLALAFNNLVSEAIKTSTGSVDSLRGVSDYSGQSGVQTAQLQSAAAVYTKHDELSYRFYLKQVTELMLQYIGTYRIYEHRLVGVDETGADATYVVNKNNMADWDWESYYTVPIIENTPEAIKQLKRQEAIQLRGAQAISNLDMLKMLGFTNANQLEQNRINESQMLQLAQFLQANPDVANAILSGVGSSGEEKSK